PAKTTSYFLKPGGGLSEKMAVEPESVDTYTYDPKKPVPSIGGANLSIQKGPMDQRATGERKDILKFVTPVLSSPTEVPGGSMSSCGARATRRTPTGWPSWSMSTLMAPNDWCSTRR